MTPFLLLLAVGTGCKSKCASHVGRHQWGRTYDGYVRKIDREIMVKFSEPVTAAEVRQLLEPFGITGWACGNTDPDGPATCWAVPRILTSGPELS